MKTTQSLSTKATQRKKDRPPNTKKYYLGDQYPGIYFTKREAHCMVFFLENFTLSQTAAQLKLSARTVECYTGSMKGKVGCTSKKALVEKVNQTHFMAHVHAIRAAISGAKG